ncbi:hypothetical protein DMUE_4349 [Dictyocoela muelleri]|nr:hypothetical protein DMUE_4349 [Dictyocoela muelleri]
MVQIVSLYNGIHVFLNQKSFLKKLTQKMKKDTIKRKSLEEKSEILEYKAKNIRKIYKRSEINLNKPISTVSDILRAREDLPRSTKEGKSNNYTTRILDNKLFEWFKNRRRSNFVIKN